MRQIVALGVWVAVAAAGAQPRPKPPVVGLPGGWLARIDPPAERRGAKAADLILAPEGDATRIGAGPPAVYWLPSSTGTGSYEVHGTISQGKALPAGYYGVFVGGSSLDGGPVNYLYCALAANGTFVVQHRFGGELHELAGRTTHQAIRRADATGRATNTVGWRVTPARTVCLINGAEVWGYTTASLVGPGKLVSTDGVAGVRVDQGLEVVVTSLRLAPAQTP